MTAKIDALLAPRALTAMELASVATPHLIAYAVAHRAFIHTGTIVDGEARDTATVHACESALDGIVKDAVASVGEWLSDMEAEGEPRFYRKASIKDAVERLARALADMAVRQENAASLNTLLELISDRDRGMAQTLIAQAEG